MKVKKILSCVLAVVLSTTFIGINVSAEEKDEVDIINILYQKGYIEEVQLDDAKIIEMSNLNLIQTYNNTDENINDFEGVMLNSLQDNEAESEILIPYVESADGELVTLSSYARGVADPRTFEKQISEIDFCVVKIKVNYDFYPQNWNGWADAYYRHGILNVSVEHDSVTANNYISNLEVRYMSRGMEIDPDTLNCKGFNSVLTMLSRASVVTNNSYTVVSATRPYFLRDSSSIADGPSFSAVAYSFTYKGKYYEPTLCVLQQDNDNTMIDFFMGLNWEF